MSYCGTREALVAAGAATPDVVARGARGGKARLDADGDRYGISPRKGWIYLNRFKSVCTAIGLPGVTNKLIDRVIAEEKARDERRDSPPAPQDRGFREFMAVFHRLSPEGQRDVERRMRFLENQTTGRFTVVVDNTR